MLRIQDLVAALLRASATLAGYVAPFALALTAGCSCHAQADSAMSSGSVEQRYATFNQLRMATRGLPDAVMRDIMSEVYDRVFSSSRCEGLEDNDLDARFDAAYLAGFYTLRPGHAQDLLAALEELERRGRATTARRTRTYETLVRTRMLDQARGFIAQHSDLAVEPIPELRVAPGVMPGQPTEWVVSDEGRILLRRPVDLTGVQVVIVSHPTCHFSQGAVRDIQADPQLRELFRAHAHWLAPQASRFDFDVVQRWNGEHPAQQTTLVVDSREWPMIDVWGTPTFYFLDHGVVRAKVIGWPAEGRRAELLAAARSVGLLPP